MVLKAQILLYKLSMKDKFGNIINRAKRKFITDIKHNAILITFIFLFWFVTALFFNSSCPFILLVGFPCPGCGLTRAFASLIQLHFQEAIQYNPTVILWVLLILSFFRQHYLCDTINSKYQNLVIVVSVATIITYIFRMKYSFPRIEPMVYNPNNLLASIHQEYNQLIERLIY